MISELHRTLDQLPAVVAYLDLDLRYRFANEAHRRWRGIDPAGLIGRRFDEAFPELFLLVRREVREALAGRRGVIELDIAPDGPFSFVRIAFAPDLADDGGVQGIVVMAADLTERRALEVRLRQSEQTFNAAFEGATIGKALLEPDGRLRAANPALARMLGYSVEELAGVDFRDITHPDDLELDLAFYAEALAGARDGYQLEKRYIRRDGAIVHALLAVSLVRDAVDAPQLFVAEIVDLSAQLRAREELAATAARLTLASDAMEGGFWQYDIDDDRFETSPALTRFVAGASALPIDLGGYMAHILPQDHDQADLSALVAGTAERSIGRYRVLTAANGLRWVKCQRQLLRDAAGRPQRIVGIATDVTDELNRQQALAEQAHTDSLTGLLNRAGFDERAGAMLAEAHATGRPCGLLLIDLDHFKPVNDRFGHAAGDAVLAEAARRMRARLRATDAIGRIGGDEFAIMVPGMDQDGLRALASRLVMDMDRPFAIDGAAILVGASVGAAGGRHDTLANMLASADGQLYAAKNAGRGGWRLAA